MENYRGTFFRQAMLAEFQLAINDLATKGEGLSGEKLTAIYLDILKRYHGPKVRIEPVYGAEWAYIPHFYFGFYVWQYATSITAANYFAQKLMHGTPADRERYLNLLRSGGSDYGYNMLKTGWPRYGEPGAVPADRRQPGEDARPGRGAARLAAFSIGLEQVEEHAPAAVHAFEQLDGPGAHALEVAMLEVDDGRAVPLFERDLDGGFEVGVVDELAVELPGEHQPARRS